jgi:hypothetical protein
LFWGVGCSGVIDVGTSEMTVFFRGWGGAGASGVIIRHDLDFLGLVESGSPD